MESEAKNQKPEMNLYLDMKAEEKLVMLKCDDGH